MRKDCHQDRIEQAIGRAVLAGSLAAAISLGMTAAAQTVQPSESPSSAATTVAAEPDDLSRIRATFLAHFPDVALTSVAATPFPDVYELLIDDELIFYTNAQLAYLIQGALIDVQSRTDLTEQRLQAMNRVDFSTLPLDLAIKQVQGSGKHTLVAFEDPNCGYCKQLHQTLMQLDDVTVYTFLFPILSEDSAIKARDVWCAPNRVQVWQDWMRKGQIPATAQCDTPISTLLTLGQTLRVRGTPALFFADGSHVSGALPLDRLRAKLDQVEQTLAGR